MSYEEILNDMLSTVPNELDKRESSIIYNALSPSAYEMAGVLKAIDEDYNQSNIDTAVGNNLDRVARDFNVYRKQASQAIRKISTSKSVDIGSRWAIEDTTYQLLEQLSVNVYTGKCEQYGEIGNAYSGELMNITEVDGAKATLSDILIYGEDVEVDESLRLKLKSKISNAAQDGNVEQYRQWALEYPGIGKAKIFPLWSGGNTVKVSITSSNNTEASSVLISEFQAYMDPNSDGLGEGKALLGAKVTITTGTLKTINIAAEIVLEEGYSDAAEASAKIAEYLRTITYKQSYVSYFYVGNILVGLNSIYDIRNLTMNGLTADITLGAEEIPTLGSLNLTVVS